MGSKAFILHEETEAQRLSWIQTSCLGFQSQVLGKKSHPFKFIFT